MDFSLLDGSLIATSVAAIGAAARFVVAHRKIVTTVLTAAESLTAAAGADGKLAPSELPAAFADYKARTAAELDELRSLVGGLAEAHGELAATVAAPAAVEGDGVDADEPAYAGFERTDTTDATPAPEAVAETVRAEMSEADVEYFKILDRLEESKAQYIASLEATVVALRESTS